MPTASTYPDFPLADPVPGPLPGDAQPLLWQHAWAALGDAFSVVQKPSPVPAPYWIAGNTPLAISLGLPANWSDSPYWLQALCGNQVPDGAQARATVYSGHQFGMWAGQLGDGRALLLGELNGMEVQLKGAGLTPFSRMGDGRAVLRSSIREYLCSEAMHGLGIPTTRALALTGSPLPVRRETMETAAIVTRVAPGFVRFGHFEHFCHHDQPDDLHQLADYVIDRYYPECREAPQPYVALLAAVTQKTAGLMAQWQAVGFCHGVMNTDNMSTLGLTIDYGPFQFLDANLPGHICNHSDDHGRYAFNNQPAVAYWNLFCLGQALLPLIDDQESAIRALENYKSWYPAAYEQRMFAKLGLQGTLPDTLRTGARSLLEDGLQLLAESQADYTIFWRRLSYHAAADGAREPVRDLFLQPALADAWLQRFEALIRDAGPEHHSSALMLASNPRYVLRNHLCELAIRAAQQGDYSKVEELHRVLSRPYDEQPEASHLAGFAPDWAANLSISCSS